MAEQMAVVKNLKAPEGVKVMQSWHPNDGTCCWQNAGVDPKGRSVGCPYLRDFADYGDARSQSLAGTWDHPLWVQLRSQKVDDECPECTSTQHSRGGCR
ncbi:SPASM domain-containing protein [Actinacidiphila glaucinigra]|uniref:SPASM domain-containing protein n=1 Tax=Actinacidiphila glaucinigra TaxID=235986 RepID=UPI00387084EE